MILPLIQPRFTQPLLRTFSGILLSLLILNTPVSLANPPSSPTAIQPLSNQPVFLTDEQNAKARLDIANFLKRFEVIRVEMVASPNFGHQAMNFNSMKRFRELGFEGTFQVIFEDQVTAKEKNVESKLAILAPGYDPKNPAPQRITVESVGQIEFIGKSQAQDVIKNQKVSLGFSGAQDFSTDILKARLLNVDVLLQLQPRLWSLPRVDIQRVAYFSRTNEKLSLQHLMGLGPVTKSTEISNWSDFIDKNIEQSTAMAVKKIGLKTLAASLPNVDLLPAYALQFHGTPDKHIENLLNGLNHSIQKAPAVFNKPIIIPVFTEFREESLSQKFSDQLDRMSIQHVRIDQGLSSELIRNLKPGSILVVHVGSLPQNIFEAFFVRATLPALLEGKNLTNKMLDHGRPFLNVTGSTNDIHKELYAGIKGSSSILNAFRTYDSRQPLRNSGVLADFFIQLRNPHSDESTFFDNFKKDAASLNGDLIGQSLLELRHSMHQRNLTPNHASTGNSGMRAQCGPIFL